jgi:hypothetical protein
VTKKLAQVFVFVSLAVSARAQTIDDGIMVAKRSLFTGDIYGYESWDQVRPEPAHHGAAPHHRLLERRRHAALERADAPAGGARQPASGTESRRYYPVPDATNPFADPVFPFANPPYAARAYSYVAVAQYEALKAAWYFKYLYNRPAPSKVDGNILPSFRPTCRHIRLRMR